MMVRLLQKLAIDVPSLNENTVTPLRVCIMYLVYSDFKILFRSASF